MKLGRRSRNHFGSDNTRSDNRNNTHSNRHRLRRRRADRVGRRQLDLRGLLRGLGDLRSRALLLAVAEHERVHGDDEEVHEDPGDDVRQHDGDDDGSHDGDERVDEPLRSEVEHVGDEERGATVRVDSHAHKRQLVRTPIQMKSVETDLSTETVIRLLARSPKLSTEADMKFFPRLMTRT